MYCAARLLQREALALDCIGEEFLAARVLLMTPPPQALDQVTLTSI